MLSVLTSCLELISCCINQTSLLHTGCTQMSFMLPGTHQGSKGSSVHKRKLFAVHFKKTTKNYILRRQLLKTDVWMKRNSNQTGVFMPLIQRIYSTKGQRYPNSVQKGQRRWMSLHLKTPKHLQTVYIQTEGLAHSSVEYGDDHFYGQRSMFGQQISLCTNA